jgi:hypothetical protein
MDGELRVEIVVKAQEKPTIPGWVQELFERDWIAHFGNRYVVSVPGTWEGFKDGTIKRLFEEFNDSIYLALAYITENTSEIVSDLEGKPVDSFDVLVHGKRALKYVKKKLRIINILSESENIYEVKAFILNLAYPEPVVKILEIYSSGTNSGLNLDYFLYEKSEVENKRSGC